MARFKIRESVKIRIGKNRLERIGLSLYMVAKLDFAYAAATGVEVAREEVSGVKVAACVRIGWMWPR